MNYDEQFHYKDLRSGQLTNGIERAAHRALLYSTGLEEQDLRKPLVAIVNSFTEMVPGHEHLRGLAQDAAKGVWEAGGVPREFNTIAICDGICQGHIGMRYPLPSRDLIADSIEYMVEAHQFDAMILMPGCDKIVPGMLIAAMRCNIPAIVISAGPMMPGRGAGRDMLTLTDMRELIGQAQTGKITIAQLAEAEKTALPGAGTCSMLGTANTMGCLAEVIGMSLPGCGLAHAAESKKRRIAKESGRRVVEMIKENLHPRDIVTREALCNGIMASMAMGASTNSTLHLPAIAHEAGIRLNLDVKTCTGRTLGEELKQVDLVENDVIFPLAAPKKQDGGLAVLHGNLAPNGAVVKKSGVKPSMYYFKGRARVFHSMEEACEAVSGDKIQQGDILVITYEVPKGGPGMREMHMVTSLIVGRGMDEMCALITDGRFSGSTRGPCIGHISPEAAAGGPIAAVQEGDEIIIDIENRSLTLLVPDEEIKRRLSNVAHVRKPATPALRRYAAAVTSADQGAVLKTPEEY